MAASSQSESESYQALEDLLTHNTLTSLNTHIRTILEANKELQKRQEQSDDQIQEQQAEINKGHWYHHTHSFLILLNSFCPHPTVPTNRLSQLHNQTARMVSEVDTATENVSKFIDAERGKDIAEREWVCMKRMIGGCEGSMVCGGNGMGMDDCEECVLVMFSDEEGKERIFMKFNR